MLVLDQFSRNVFRDSPHAFAQDALALALAQELVASGHDRSLSLAQRSFAHRPYAQRILIGSHASETTHLSWLHVVGFDNSRLSLAK